MSDSIPSERREYFRIKDNVEISLSKITDTLKLDDILNKPSSFLLGSAINALDLDHHAVLSKIKRSDPDIALYLDTINKKINLIADNIIDNTPDMKELIHTEIDISASGIAINSNDPFSENDFVLIKLLLLPEKKGILCTGCIKRIKVNNNNTELCIDFAQITEPDRELIIKHTIAKQLEQARDKHAGD